MLLQSALQSVLFLFLRVRYGGMSSFPPPLSAEREKECFRLLREKADMSARDELIEHNLRLVMHIVKKYSTPASEDDLVSVGTIGLIKAVDSFDPSVGSRFATYAGKCLTNEILMYFRSQRRYSNEVSLSETIDIDKDGNPLTWGDIIATEDTIADDLDLKIRSAKAIDIINSALTPRERKIITLRYGLNGDAPITQRETAERLKISRSYVSRIEAAALAKLAERL